MTIKDMSDVIEHEGRRYLLADLAHYMDDEIRERLHSTLAPCAAQAFWAGYVAEADADDVAHVIACSPDVTTDWEQQHAAAVLGRKGGQAGRGASKVRVTGTPAEVSERMRAVRAARRAYCSRCHQSIPEGQGFALYREAGGRDAGGVKWAVHDLCIAEDVAAGRLVRVSPFAFEPAPAAEFVDDEM